MKIKYDRLIYAFAILTTGLIIACSSVGSDETAAFIEDDLPPVYKQNCLSCHGNQLQGRVGPNIQTVGSRLSEEEISRIVTDGQGGMPSFGNRLEEEEITSITRWLMEQSQERGEMQNE